MHNIEAQHTRVLDKQYLLCAGCVYIHTQIFVYAYNTESQYSYMLKAQHSLNTIYTYIFIHTYTNTYMLSLCREKEGETDRESTEAQYSRVLKAQCSLHASIYIYIYSFDLCLYISICMCVCVHICIQF